METKTIMYYTLASPKSAMDRLWIWNIYIYVHIYVYTYADSTQMFFWEGIDVMLENYRMVYSTYMYAGGAKNV